MNKRLRKHYFDNVVRHNNGKHRIFHIKGVDTALIRISKYREDKPIPAPICPVVIFVPEGFDQFVYVNEHLDHDTIISNYGLTNFDSTPHFKAWLTNSGEIVDTRIAFINFKKFQEVKVNNAWCSNLLEKKENLEFKDLSENYIEAYSYLKA